MILLRKLYIYMVSKMFGNRFSSLFSKSTSLCQGNFMYLTSISEQHILLSKKYVELNGFHVAPINCKSNLLFHTMLIETIVTQEITFLGT